MKNQLLNRHNKVILSISVICLFFTQVALGQKNIYENKQFKNITSTHQSIAILPFLASVNLEQGLSDEMQLELEASEGYAVQEALETYFLKMEKKKALQGKFPKYKRHQCFSKKTRNWLQHIRHLQHKRIGGNFRGRRYY